MPSSMALESRVLDMSCMRFNLCKGMKMKWISVKDRLPADETKYYIVCYDSWGDPNIGKVGVCIWMQKYKNNKGLYWDWLSKPRCPAWDITYWMPLPEKPIQ